MLQNIYNQLATNKLEESFELLIQNETEYSNNSTYWSLRGDLCCLIKEFNIAISCYEKSLALDLFNSIPLNRLLEIFKSSNDIDSYNSYIEKQNLIKSNYLSKLLNVISKDLGIQINDSNLSYLNDTLSTLNHRWCFFNNDYFISNDEKIYISYFFDTDNDYLKRYNVLIPLNESYIENATKLIEHGVNEFSTIMLYNGKLYITAIDSSTINEFKQGNRNSTIVFHYLNEGDSNVFSLYKNIPEQFREKFSRILLKDTIDFNINNMAKIPLLASISVSGHEIFTQYPCPKLMHNIEVGHGSMPLKACGALDKIPNFAFSTNSYNKVDTLCVSSHIDLLIWRASTEINPEKILISGNPRTDLLIKSNGKKNLEKILKTKLDEKQIIFNMPTFHTHDNSGRINGNALLNDFIKIPQFDYKKFDNFLGENNYICILKVHHAEQSIISNTNKLRNFKNIYTISNIDLKKNNLDLYEVLNSGDLLITDYSSIYSDFLFMNKPIVFTNYDIEEYRNNRGLALEPYDFWTAGPKVTTQDLLQEELIKSLSDDTYYLDKRNSLKPVFFNYTDGESCSRVWEHINTLTSSKK